VSGSACPSCRAPADPADRFCESCGSDLAGAGPAPDPDAAWLSSTMEPGTGRTAVVRRPTDHDETDLGSAAAVTDRGLRHDRNEDAMALAVHGDRVAAVVCDGVSTTTDPERASAAAARAALRALGPALHAERWPGPTEAALLLNGAVEAAQQAVARLPGGTDPDGEAPSTTIVAALVAPGSVTVANIGDSRAYWLTDVPDESFLLTVDDSWAEEAIAAGTPPERAYADPQAHVITRWLGADADDVLPKVTAVDTHAPGTVVICTDGLWNYFESADHLHAVVDPADDGPDPLALARRLVAAALEAGGHDNVTVAVIPAHPARAESAHPEE